MSIVTVSSLESAINCNVYISIHYTQEVKNEEEEQKKQHTQSRLIVYFKSKSVQRCVTLNGHCTACWNTHTHTLITWWTFSFLGLMLFARSLLVQFATISQWMRAYVCVCVCGLSSCAASAHVCLYDLVGINNATVCRCLPHCSLTPVYATAPANQPTNEMRARERKTRRKTHYTV